LGVTTARLGRCDGADSERTTDVSPGLRVESGCALALVVAALVVAALVVAARCAVRLDSSSSE
jgi:hypothetical protein